MTAVFLFHTISLSEHVTFSFYELWWTVWLEFTRCTLCAWGVKIKMIITGSTKREMYGCFLKALQSVTGFTL